MNIKTKLKIVIFCLFIVAYFFKVEGQENRPYFVHDSGSYGGMFAVFSSVLCALDYYEKGNYSGLEINFNNGVYLDEQYGPNWWNYYFEPIALGNKTLNIFNCNLEYYLHLAFTGFKFERHYANNLISKYVHILPNIEAEASEFYNKNLNGSFVIGLHYRGTDKIHEHPRRSYESVYTALYELIKNLDPILRTTLKVYVATDEQQFIEFLQGIIPHLLIYNDFVRSPDQATPLHYGNDFYSSNYFKGKEGLIDCLMLSKSNILLRPAGSCFSWAATLFNPDLPCFEY